MPEISSLVFRHAPRLITLLAWAVIMGALVALLVFAALSLITSAGGPSPEVLELAPFRWRRSRDLS